MKTIIINQVKRISFFFNYSVIKNTNHNLRHKTRYRLNSRNKRYNKASFNILSLTDFDVNQY